MDSTPEEAAARLELFTFWTERIFTTVLTAFWIYSCHSFFTDLKNPFLLFNHVAKATLPWFVGTNILWLLCGLLRAVGRYLESARHDPQGDWIPLRRAFWIERSGMLLLCVSCLCHLRGGLENITNFGICTAPCVILFPFANLCYLGRFVFGEELSLPLYDKKRDGFKNWFGGLQKITSFVICKALCLILFLLWPFHLFGKDPSRWSKEKGAILDKSSRRTKQVADGNDADDTSMSFRDMGEWETDSQLYDDILPDLVEEEETMEEANWGGRASDKAISEASFEMLDIKDDKQELQKVEETVEGAKEEEKESDKAVSEESFEMLDNKDDELRGKLEELKPLVEETKGKAEQEEEKESDKVPSEESFEMLDTKVDKLGGKIEELLEVEETKEEAKQEEKESDKSVSEASLEMMAIKVDKQRRRMQELEKELAIVNELVQKLGETSKKIAEKYRGHYEMWEKHKNELVCRLSAATTQAEFYSLQAQESKENRRKLKEQKNDLITKLCAANASSELYRSLLHDAGLYM